MTDNTIRAMGLALLMCLALAFAPPAPAQDPTAPAATPPPAGDDSAAGSEDGSELGDDGFIDVPKRPTRFRVAAPAFNALNELPAGDKAPEKLTEIMRDTLELVGIFEIVDPAAYPPLAAPGKTEDYASWQLINTIYLVRGDIARIDGKRYQVEFRCFDVQHDRMLIGKRYTGEEELFTRMVYRFMDELMEQITGTRTALDAKISYVSDQTGRNEIRVMNVDGGEDQPVTRNRTLNLSPAWAPGGHKLVYTGYRDRNPDIYLADLEAKQQYKIFSKTGLNFSPEFSPDGLMIAFSREASDGNIDIYVMDQGGKDLRRITTARSNELSPSFSPDGKRIAFVSDRTGNPQVYVLDLSRGGESPSNPAVRLTTRGSYNTSPAWSPNGRYIAFTGRDGGQFDIMLIDMMSKNRLTRLTRSYSNEENPSWSPDSFFLVYDSTKYGNHDIFIMSIYGGEPRRITTSRAKERMPSWSPRLAQ